MGARSRHFYHEVRGENVGLRQGDPTHNNPHSLSRSYRRSTKSARRTVGIFTNCEWGGRFGLFAFALTRPSYTPFQREQSARAQRVDRD